MAASARTGSARSRRQTSIPEKSGSMRSTTTTSAPPPKPEQMAVNVDSDIVKACNLKFTNVEDAPKFDYDSDDLSPPEKDVLSQIAKCLTTGPLKGRSVDLVGRADPRGES